jgi:hypothetical protein
VTLHSNHVIFEYHAKKIPHASNHVILEYHAKNIPHASNHVILEYHAKNIPHASNHVILECHASNIYHAVKQTVPAMFIMQSNKQCQQCLSCSQTNSASNVYHVINHASNYVSNV